MIRPLSFVLACLIATLLVRLIKNLNIFGKNSRPFWAHNSTFEAFEELFLDEKRGKLIFMSQNSTKCPQTSKKKSEQAVQNIFSKLLDTRLNT